METNINYIDLILLLPLIWAAYKGFKKGLVLEIASIVGLIVGFYAAIKFSGFVGNKLDAYMEISEQWLAILSFITTFIGIVFLVHLLGKILEKTLKLVALGFFNRVAGSIFSILKTALVLSFILFFIHQIDENLHVISEETKNGSLFFKPIQKVAPNVLPIIKDLEIKKLIDEEKSDSLISV